MNKKRRIKRCLIWRVSIGLRVGKFKILVQHTTQRYKIYYEDYMRTQISNDLVWIRYQNRSCGRSVDDVVDLARQRLSQLSLVERFRCLLLLALSLWSSRVRVNRRDQQITPPRGCTRTPGKVQQGFAVQAWSTTGPFPVYVCNLSRCKCASLEGMRRRDRDRLDLI